MIRPRLALRITEDHLSDGRVIRYVGVRPASKGRRINRSLLTFRMWLNDEPPRRQSLWVND